MQNYILALLTCSFTMSAIALIYIAGTPILEKRYSEKGRYYAWLVVIIGLIVPFRPQLGNAIVKMDIPGGTAVPIIQIGNGTPVTIPIPATTPIDNTMSPHYTLALSWSWWQIAAVIWLLGVIVFLAYHVIKHYSFVKMTRRWSENITDETIVMLLQSLKEEMGITKRIELYLCSCAGSPMMIGFSRPRILLPTVKMTLDELRFILKHELVHHKRKDLLYKYLVLTAAAVHWFNPVIYFIVKAIATLCETSCDAEVVRNTDSDNRQFYSEAIIGVVRYQSKLKTALSTSFNGGKKGMKKRISSIMDISNKRTGVIIVCIASIMTLGTGVVFAFSALSPAAYVSIPEDASSFIYQYDDEMGGIMIKGYIGTNRDVIIPPTIDGYPVLFIAGTLSSGYTPPTAAFSDVDSVTIPDTVTEIGFAAFRESTVKTVIIPDSVIYIDYHAFDGCTQLSEETMLRILENQSGSTKFD